MSAALLLREAAAKMRADEDPRWGAVAEWMENVEHRAYGVGLPSAREVEVRSALSVARLYLGHDAPARPQPIDPQAAAEATLHAFVGDGPLPDGRGMVSARVREQPRLDPADEQLVARALRRLPEGTSEGHTRTTTRHGGTHDDEHDGENRNATRP